ncbi:MAG: translation elongation factor Ts [Phycisphaerae bacterium]
MADISAATVMKLRKMSGQGMMDCKQALTETNGDLDKAMDILRKKGMATMAKRAERETSQGIVVSKSCDGGKTVVFASLCCETDFVAKSDDFISVADKLGDYGIACSADTGNDTLAETELNGKKLKDLITESVSKTGEKTQIGDFARFKLQGPGLIAVYIHFNHKVGTMVEIATSDDKVAASDIIKTAGNDIAMHITATKPLALDKTGIDPKILEQEKAIYAEQVKGKPANIVDKIVEGKLQKFYAENCLLEQPFVKDDSKTVAQMLEESAKAAGGTAKITRFVRFEVG